MSTDSSLPESGDSGITERPADASAEPEPFLAEAVDDDEHIVAAELVEPVDPARLRLGFRRPPAPPGPPHPGFWWAVGSGARDAHRGADRLPGVLPSCHRRPDRVIAPGSGLAPRHGWQTANQDTRASAARVDGRGRCSASPLGLGGPAPGGGADWPRQIALRLPTVTHVVLAVWPCRRWPRGVRCLSGGLSRYSRRPKGACPAFGDLPQLRRRHRTAHAGGVGAVVGLVAREPPGRTGSKALARQATLRIQLVVAAHRAAFCWSAWGRNCIRLFRPYASAGSTIPDGMI